MFIQATIINNLIEYVYMGYSGERRDSNGIPDSFQSNERDWSTHRFKRNNSNAKIEQSNTRLDFFGYSNYKTFNLVATYKI